MSRQCHLSSCVSRRCQCSRASRPYFECCCTAPLPVLQLSRAISEISHLLLLLCRLTLKASLSRARKSSGGIHSGPIICLPSKFTVPAEDPWVTIATPASMLTNLRFERHRLYAICPKGAISMRLTALALSHATSFARTSLTGDRQATQNARHSVARYVIALNIPELAVQYRLSHAHDKNYGKYGWVNHYQLVKTARTTGEVL